MYTNTSKKDKDSTQNPAKAVRRRTRHTAHSTRHQSLRSGTEMLCAFFRTHERNLLRDALRYGGVILSFAAGAGLGSVAALAWGAPAIWCSCAFLAVSFGLMFLSGEK